VSEDAKRIEETEEDFYVSVSPKRRVKGIWMPRERYDALLKRVEEREFRAASQKGENGDQK
jgi:hypothetical protein